MIKKLLLGCALVASCLPALVVAKGTEGGVKRAQLLDFTGRQSGEVLDVGAVHSLPLQPPAPVEAAMLAGFGDPAPAPGYFHGEMPKPVAAQILSGSSFGAAQAFVRSPVIAVPQWMRTGRAPFAGQLMPAGMPAIGNCGARDYMPSGMMRASSEERRRILYPLVVQSACRYGIPVGLFDAMIIQESRYNPSAVSPKGAFGLGQLMPGTAAELRVNPYDIGDNLHGAAKYLSAHLREFNDPALALAAYNAGPGRVRRRWAVPRINETQNYVQTIMWNWRNLEANAQRY